MSGGGTSIQRPYDDSHTGRIEWSGSGDYYSVTGTTFTLLRAGSGVIKGRSVNWEGSQSTGALTKKTRTNIFKRICTSLDKWYWGE